MSSLFSCSIRGHDGVAELLVETLGSQLVNIRDAKGRWASQSALLLSSAPPLLLSSSAPLLSSSLCSQATPCCLTRLCHITHKSCPLPLPACRSPLHAAAFAESLPGLQLVLRRGSEVDAVDDAGRSALMVAADRGQTAAVG